MESHWSQWYWMEHQWIQCYDEWNTFKVNVIEGNIGEINGILNGFPLSSMLSKETSVNSMLWWMESHWSQCFWLGHQWIHCYSMEHQFI